MRKMIAGTFPGYMNVCWVLSGQELARVGERRRKVFRSARDRIRLVMSDTSRTGWVSS